MPNNKEPEYVDMFGIINPQTGEVTHEVIHPSEEDKKLIAQKNERLLQQQNNLKTVKKVSATPKPKAVKPLQQQQSNITIRPTEASTEVKKAVKLLFNKTKNTLNNEYLICIQLEEQDQLNPSWMSTRWLKAMGRKRMFTTLVSMIDDLIDECKVDFYDPVDYEESFVLCSGVKLDEKISLLDFIKLCIENNEGTHVEPHMLKYMQAVVSSYENQNFSYIEQWIKEEYDPEMEACMPQSHGGLYYPNMTGEDLN